MRIGFNKPDSEEKLKTSTWIFLLAGAFTAGHLMPRGAGSLHLAPTVRAEPRKVLPPAKLGANNRWVYAATADGAVMHNLPDGAKISEPTNNPNDRECGVVVAGDNGTAHYNLLHGVAVAGDNGTAYSQGYGVAVISSGGTAMCGAQGTSVSWQGGIVTVGDGGEAIAKHGGEAIVEGDGIAVAQFGGSASAWDGGIIALGYLNDAGRLAFVLGTVGQGGLKQGVPYKLDDHHNIIPAGPRSNVGRFKAR